jgi:hypothetical protein
VPPLLIIIIILIFSFYFLRFILKKVCKPIKVGDPVDEGFKLMKDIRVDKTMVDGKATFKTINIH